MLILRYSGTPLELMENGDSKFHSLCAADGPIEWEFLWRAASEVSNKLEKIAIS